MVDQAEDGPRGVSVLPPALALRKEAEDELLKAAEAPSERIVRRIVEDLNAKIREMLLKPRPARRWA